MGPAAAPIGPAVCPPRVQAESGRLEGPPPARLLEHFVSAFCPFLGRGNISEILNPFQPSRDHSTG